MLSTALGGRNPWAGRGRARPSQARELQQDVSLVLCNYWHPDMVINAAGPQLPVAHMRGEHITFSSGLCLNTFSQRNWDAFQSNQAFRRQRGAPCPEPCDACCTPQHTPTRLLSLAQADSWKRALLRGDPLPGCAWASAGCLGAVALPELAGSWERLQPRLPAPVSAELSLSHRWGHGHCQGTPELRGPSPRSFQLKPVGIAKPCQLDLGTPVSRRHRWLCVNTQVSAGVWLCTRVCWSPLTVLVAKTSVFAWAGSLPRSQYSCPDFRSTSSPSPASHAALSSFLGLCECSDPATRLCTPSSPFQCPDMLGARCIPAWAAPPSAPGFLTSWLQH